MNIPKESRIEEVFIIKNDEIDFLGTIINARENKSQIYGRIWLPNSKPIVFYSTKGRQEVLREVLKGQCHTLASQYQAKTYYFPLKTPMAWKEFQAYLLNVDQDNYWYNNLVNNLNVN